jgi:hypothetical protein
MGIDPETLERLRRGLRLRLSPTGEFRFDDGPVTHPRVIEALRHGLDATDEGEPIVRLGEQWAYLIVEDCVLRATAVWRERDQLRLRLDDGRELPVPVQTLWEEPHLGLRCQVPSRATGHPLSVRFTNRAQMQLAEWIEEVDGRPHLRVGDLDLEIVDHPRA